MWLKACFHSHNGIDWQGLSLKYSSLLIPSRDASCSMLLASLAGHLETPSTCSSCTGPTVKMVTSLVQFHQSLFLIEFGLGVLHHTSLLSTHYKHFYQMFYTTIQVFVIHNSAIIEVIDLENLQSFNPPTPPFLHLCSRIWYVVVTSTCHQSSSTQLSSKLYSCSHALVFHAHMVGLAMMMAIPWSLCLTCLLPGIGLPAFNTIFSNTICNSFQTHLISWTAGTSTPYFQLI